MASAGGVDLGAGWSRKSTARSASQTRQPRSVSPSISAAPAAGWQLLVEGPDLREAGSRRWPKPSGSIASDDVAALGALDGEVVLIAVAVVRSLPSSPMPTRSSTPRPWPGMQTTAEVLPLRPSGTSR